MEYLNGDSLAQQLKDGPLSAARFFEVCSNVLSGLEHAHENNIVHRDLKPSNIIFSKDSAGSGVYKIIDFGIARLETGAGQTGRTLTSTSVPFGSPSYMSPEQCRSERVDSLSDIYSMGCVMYECLVGKTPFTADTAYETMYKHMSQELPAFGETAKATESRRLLALIARCLAKNPAHRPQSASELARELTEIFSSGADKIDLFSGRFCPERKSRLLPLVLSCIALLAGLAFVLFLPGRHAVSKFETLSAQDKITRGIEKLITKPGKSLRDLFALGRLQLKSDSPQDHADAEKTYSQALKLCPLRGPATARAACLALRAKAEWMQGKYKACVQDFDESIALTRKQDTDVFHDILLERVRFLVHIRKYDEALRDLNTVAESFSFTTRTTFGQVMDHLDGISQKLDKGGESRRSMLNDIALELQKTRPQSESESLALRRLASRVERLFSDIELKLKI
jgi:hypothetical protein